MVLDETKQFVLIVKISTKMQADALSIAVLQPVVEFLVVAEIKTLLLEFPLQVPICLSDKEETRMLLLGGRDRINPIFRFWTRPSPQAPSPFEDWVHHQ